MRMLLLFLTLGLLATTTANAECIRPGPPLEELGRASAVFSGKVIREAYIDDTNERGISGKRLVITLKVERVWKGDLREEVKMYTSEMKLDNGNTWSMAEDFDF